MGIVDRQHEGGLFGKPRHQPLAAVVDPVGQLCSRGEERSREPGGSDQPLSAPEVLDGGAEQSAQHLERGGRGEMTGPDQQRAGSGCPGGPDGVVHERALASTGPGLEQHGAALAAAERGHSGVDRGDLRGALVQPVRHTTPPCRRAAFRWWHAGTVRVASISGTRTASAQTSGCRP